jgi:hypothetical protein
MHAPHNESRSQARTPKPDNNQTMNYRQLRQSLRACMRIPTLGGRSSVTIHNPAGGMLVAMNSNCPIYEVSEADWNNARVIRSRNPRNPWASRLYSETSMVFSYGLIHAAALLRHLLRAGCHRSPEQAKRRAPPNRCSRKNVFTRTCFRRFLPKLPTPPDGSRFGPVLSHLCILMR